MMADILNFSALIIVYAYDIAMMLLVYDRTFIGYLSLRPKKAQ